MVLRLTRGQNRDCSLTSADGHLTLAIGLKFMRGRVTCRAETEGRTLEETAAVKGSRTKGPGIPKGTGLSAETPRGATADSVRNSA